jgi:hypothetical protein
MEFYGNQETDLRSMIQEALEEHPVIRRLAGRRVVKRGFMRRAFGNKFAGAGSNVNSGEEADLRSMIQEALEEHPVIRRLAGRRLVGRGLMRRAIGNRLADSGYDEEMSLFGGSQRRGPKGWKISDDKIKEDICEAIYIAGDIDASEIEINVQNGMVTLAGSAPDRWTKHVVEDLAEHTFGVEDVKNDISVVRGELTSNFNQKKEAMKSKATLS